MHIHIGKSQHIARHTAKSTRQYPEKDLKKHTDYQCQQKSNNLVVGNAAGKYPDTDVWGTHQQQAQVACPYRAVAMGPDIWQWWCTME